ncbi:MAG: class I SAM-dependent methyltransferase [Flavobacteriales bacterium]|jgi:predicted O-methyltransferase YrrM|nr:class I SAM-dependent methyltransferase [Flavobacteriales bacterium]
MLEKLKTIGWFISKPKYIPQVFQVLKRRKNKELENSSAEALSWCKTNAISQSEALKKLGINSEIIELNTLFPELINKAQETAKNCPVKMGGEGATSFLYTLIKASNSQKIIETGVAYGWSTLAILLAIKENKNAFLISNDMPYIKMNNDDYVGCVVPHQLKDQWKLQREADIKGIPMALNHFNQQIDACHYDSDKSYTGRMWASPLLWKALKDGGLFISDDINDNLGFKHFCDSIDQTPIIIEHLGKYVGILRK